MAREAVDISDVGREEPEAGPCGRSSVHAAHVVDLGARGPDPERPRLGNRGCGREQRVDDHVLAHQHREEQVNRHHVPNPGTVDAVDVHGNQGSDVAQVHKHQQKAVGDECSVDEVSEELWMILGREVVFQVEVYLRFFWFWLLEVQGRCVSFHGGADGELLCLRIDDSPLQVKVGSCGCGLSARRGAERVGMALESSKSPQRGLVDFPVRRQGYAVEAVHV